MANPLTFYIPIKQDPATQLAAQTAHDNFVAGVQAASMAPTSCITRGWR